jgi:IclR family KDG regulon transcriptional repressor
LQDSWLGQLSKTALVISASLGYQPETPPANAHHQHA